MQISCSNVGILLVNSIHITKKIRLQRLACIWVTITVHLHVCFRYRNDQQRFMTFLVTKMI